MTTDMGHCEWCSWDLYLDQAVDGMHPDCVPKVKRRNLLRNELIPIMMRVGITAPDRNNLLTGICRLIEMRLDEQEQTS